MSGSGTTTTATPASDKHESITISDARSALEGVAATLKAKSSNAKGKKQKKGQEHYPEGEGGDDEDDDDDSGIPWQRTRHKWVGRKVCRFIHVVGSK